MRIFKIAAIAALAALSLTAAAKDASQIRIYINPGHGAWNSDSRPCKILREVNGQTTIVDPKSTSVYPDTTAFFETNTNIRKCLAIVDKLESYGLKIDRTKNQTNSNKYRRGAALDLSNNICMSHVMGGPYPQDGSVSSVICDRPLTTIAAEAEYNDFDMFLSVHSNALTSNDGDKVNFPLFIYRGYDTQDLSPGSKLMAQKGWPYLYNMAAHPRTINYTYIKGDIDFYGEYFTAANGAIGYLGALRHHVPGYLAEGYYHSNQPCRFRMMNFDACRIEGYQYARGIADYFGLQKESTGDIWGVVRDSEEIFNHSLYNPVPSSNDIYLPLNGADVVLMRNGVEVAHKTTDNQYNGVFVFPDLQPGTYTLVINHDGHRRTTQDVTVTAATTSYPHVFMEKGESTGRANYAYDLDYSFNETDYKYEISYMSTGECPGSTLVLTPTTGSDQEAVRIDMGEVQYGLNTFDLDPYLLDRSQGYNWSVELRNNPITSFKAIVSSSGRTFDNNVSGGVVVFNDPEDPDFGTIVTAAGNASGFDIYTPDGVHKAGPYHQGSSTMNPTHAYSLGRGAYSDGKTVFSDWSDDASGYWVFDPKNPSGLSNMLQGTRESSGRFVLNGNALGGSCPGLSFRGKGNDRVLYAFCEDYPTESSNNLVRYRLGNDWTITSSPEAMDSPTDVSGLMLNTNVEVMTTDYGIFLSQLRGEGNNTSTCPGFIVVDYDCNLLFNSASLSDLTSCAQGMALSADGSRFAISNANNQILVYDVAWNNGKPTFSNCHSYSAAVPSTANKYHAQMQFDPAGNLVTFARGGGLRIYSVPDRASESEGRIVTTPARSELVLVPGDHHDMRGGDRANFAYDLSHTPDKDKAVFHIRFMSTGYCPAATLVLTPETGDESDVVRVDLGEAYWGENTYELDAYSLDDTKLYNWAVELQSNPVRQFKQVAAGQPYSNAATMGGVVIFDDTEDPNYGTIVTAGGYASGFDVYYPDGTHKAGPYHAGSQTMNARHEASLYRGAYSNGKVVFADWSEDKSGYYVFDPENPQYLWNMLQGTRESSGRTMNGTVAIGGSCPGLSFRGKGADRELYAFCEDYPTANANNLVKYNVGDSWFIFDAPEIMNSPADVHSLMLNGNVEVKATDYGIFLSQLRYEGNNTLTVPGFILIDYDCNLLFNSGNLPELTSSGPGLALSADGSRFAISEDNNSIFVADVEWRDGVPSFLNTVSYPALTGATGNRYHTQMQFDPAGNLVVFGRGSGLKIYAVPDRLPGASQAPAREGEQTGRITSTPARAGYVIRPGILTEVEEVWNDNAPVEYFNLQGQKIMNPAPGTVVIRRQGTRSEKIIIR